MTPTRRTAGALAGVAATTPWIGIRLAVVLFLFIVVLAMADGWQVRGSPEASSEVPDRLSRGVPAPLEVTVRTRRQFRLRQPTPADIAVEPQEAQGRLTATIVARRRGRHVLTRPVIRVQGPLGLGAWTHRVGTEREVVVYPDLLAARRLAHAVRTGRFQEEGRRTRGQLGLGTEFESIREYQPDDDIRQVNWRATQRVGKPMSNQYRVEQDREVLCLVDTGRLMAAEVSGRSRLDAALDAVAAVASVADVVGDRIGVLAFDSEVRRSVPPRRANAGRVLHAVFDLESRPVDSDYSLAFRTAAAAKRSLVMVFTDIFEEAAARPLVEAASILARHHAVVVASVGDRDLDQLVTTSPNDALEAARRLVASDIVDGRRRSVARIESAGATVIEAPEDDLASRCVAAYLRAKAKARL